MRVIVWLVVCMFVGVIIGVIVCAMVYLRLRQLLHLLKDFPPLCSGLLLVAQCGL